MVAYSSSFIEIKHSTQDASPPLPAQQQPVIANNASPQQPDNSVTNEPQSMHDDPLNNGDSSNNDSPFLGQHQGIVPIPWRA